MAHNHHSAPHHTAAHHIPPHHNAHAVGLTHNGMHTGVRHHNVQYHRVFDPSMIADAVYVLTAKGVDSLCGCPVFCPGPSVTCGSGPFLPDELHGLITLEEYSDLVHTLNEIFHRTHWPLVPLCFLLFLDICAYGACHNLRMKEVHHALDSANQKLAEKGLHWQPLDCEGYIAKLCVNNNARQGYFARGGQPAAYPSGGATRSDAFEDR